MLPILDSRYFPLFIAPYLWGAASPGEKKEAKPPAKLETMCCPIYNPTSIRFYTPYFGREIERCLRPVLCCVRCGLQEAALVFVLVS